MGWEFLAGLVVVAVGAAIWATLKGGGDGADSWDAAFTDPRTTKLWSGKNGIYLGYAHDDTARQHELTYSGDRHIMTIGPNGSGKSMRLLYQNLMRLKDWSVVVVDPKGDLARLTLEARHKAGSKCIVLDPFGASGFPSYGLNPIACLNPNDSDFPDDAMTLAEAIIRQDGRDSHWAASAQELVAALIADSDESGHLFQLQSGHHSNLKAAGVASSRRSVLVIS